MNIWSGFRKTRVLFLATLLVLSGGRQGYAAENREDYLAVFDADYYYSQYPNLQESIGYDPEKLLDHFVSTGAREGRSGNPEFNLRGYVFHTLRKHMPCASAGNGASSPLIWDFLYPGRSGYDDFRGIQGSEIYQSISYQELLMIVAETADGILTVSLESAEQEMKPEEGKGGSLIEQGSRQVSGSGVEYQEKIWSIWNRQKTEQKRL